MVADIDEFKYLRLYQRLQPTADAAAPVSWIRKLGPHPMDNDASGRFVLKQWPEIFAVARDDDDLLDPLRAQRPKPAEQNLVVCSVVACGSQSLKPRLFGSVCNGIGAQSLLARYRNDRWKCQSAAYSDPEQESMETDKIYIFKFRRNFADL